MIGCDNEKSYLAFIATFDNSIEFKILKSKSEFNDSNSTYVDYEIKIQDAKANNDLCDEMIKLKKLNKKLHNKVSIIENEKNNLYEALKIVKIENSHMKAQKDALGKELKSFQDCQKKICDSKII